MLRESGQIAGTSSAKQGKRDKHDDGLGEAR